MNESKAYQSISPGQDDKPIISVPILMHQRRNLIPLRRCHLATVHMSIQVHNLILNIPPFIIQLRGDQFGIFNVLVDDCGDDWGREGDRGGGKVERGSQRRMLPDTAEECVLSELQPSGLVGKRGRLNGKIADRCETGCSCFRGDGTARTNHQYTSSFSCLLTCHRVVCSNYVLQGSEGRSDRLDQLLLLYVDLGARKIRMIVQ